MTRHWPFYTPFARKAEEFVVDAGLAREAGLQEWAKAFQLGTAGYRDLLDPENLFNLSVPFNALTMAVVLAARADLAVEHGMASLHVGGEVRPHTQEFIDLAARIYAARGITVHLRPEGVRTTPIWLSSFGVFHRELDGGENFTASHSQSYKGGWKPMDASGGQLLEMAGQVADRVRTLVDTALRDGLAINLASSHDDLIRRDFDPLAAYVDYLRLVVPPTLLAGLPAAFDAGFRAGFCTEGGSMGAAANAIFGALEIPVGEDEPVFLTHEQENTGYHGIGIFEGVNYGVDPGKWQVYKNVGAQELLAAGRCHVFFIWDPDGDRFNMVTVAPVDLAQTAEAAGLEVDPLDDDRCLVFFKPNQIYFMLTGLKIDSLRAAGELDRYDWIVATTFPTSLSIGEMAQREGGLKTFRVPVGFKHFAALVRDLEGQIATGRPNCAATDVTRQTTEFGPRPRLLMMAEESGGAALGPPEPISSCSGARTSLAPKEKDGMQIGVMALCLAARLHRDGGSFAGYYLELLDRCGTSYRFYERKDVTLFDESLQGEARSTAHAAGNRRKEATVAWFSALEKMTPAEATRHLVAALPDGVELPPLRRAFGAGDGTYLEFDGQWFELRASGTDAVLRYYMEGRDRDQVSALNTAFTQLEIEG